MDRAQRGPHQCRPHRGKLTRNAMKGAIKTAIHLGTLGKATADLLSAINVLGELQDEIRQKIRQRAEMQKVQSYTYQEWLERGYHVIRGQKHTGRNALNQCTFLPNQVTPRNGYTGNGRKYPLYDIDPDEHFDWGIDPWD